MKNIYFILFLLFISQRNIGQFSWNNALKLDGTGYLALPNNAKNNSYKVVYSDIGEIKFSEVFPMVQLVF